MRVKTKWLLYSTVAVSWPGVGGADGHHDSSGQAPMRDNARDTVPQ